MAGQGPARRRRASRMHPVRLAVLTVVCLLLSGMAGAAAYFFPVVVAGVGQTGQTVRSEEHTFELQSRLHLVCSLLPGKNEECHPVVDPLPNVGARGGTDNHFGRR